MIGVGQSKTRGVDRSAGMRRKHNVIVEPGEDGRDVEQDSIEEHSKQRQVRANV